MLTKNGGMAYDFPEPSFNIERKPGPDGQEDLIQACVINASKGRLSVVVFIRGATVSTG